jgi:hypothetical protein
MKNAPNKRSALDARMAVSLHIERPWPGASESERSALGREGRSNCFPELEVGPGEVKIQP